MKQTLIWTTLPHGLTTTGKLALSVRVSPRLEPDGAEAHLGDFNDLEHWAQHNFRFDVVFDNGERVNNLKPEKGIEPDTWTKIFRPSLRVRKYKPTDLRARKIRSFPVGNVVSWVRDHYVEAGLHHPESLPSTPWLVGQERKQTDPRFSEVNVSDPSVQEKLEPKLDALLDSHGYVPVSAPDPDLDFYQALVFHGFKGGDRSIPVKKLEPDFHEAMAVLADYPALQRKLGLVFELEVPIPPGISGATRVKVEPHWRSDSPSITTVPVRPWTAFSYNAAAERFLPASSTTELQQGQLDLSSPKYEVMQVDPDGAAMRTVQFAASLDRLTRYDVKAWGTPEESGLPALHTAGISLARTGRAKQLWTKLQRSGSLEDAITAGTGDNQTLTAEDVTRGLRVDVFDPGKGEWCSLHRRRGTYIVNGKPIATNLEDEGTLTANTSSSTNTADTDLYAHETRIRWNGWSLSVKRPGLPLAGPVPGEGDPLADSREPTETDNPLRLITRFKVPNGSLPRLRFGWKYRVRARLADVAGNSLSLAEASGSMGVTNEVPYLRFEPVASPALVPGLASGENFKPGESAARVTIRSANDTPSKDSVASLETSIRDVLPPRTTQLVAEQHGRFDGTSGMLSDKATYDMIVARDKATLPETSTTLLEDVPYLPDPMAAGATLQSLPGSSGPLQIGFNTGVAWPHAKPFRIELEEGTGGSSWDESSRTLTVSLPKAGTATVRLSSYVPLEADLDSFGVWNWLDAACPAALKPRLKTLATTGRHWMISPFQELTFVHAVQQPLELPQPGGLRVEKSLGATFVDLSGAIVCHGPSTGRVDIEATWTDRFDDGTGDGRIAQEGHACTLTVDDVAAASIAAEGQQHALGDTRYRRVTYTAVGTSRFREYFQDGTAATAGLKFDRIGGSIALDVLNSARPAAPEIEYIVPIFAWEDGKTAEGTFRKRGGGGVRVYLRRNWWSSGDGELLGVLLAQGPQPDCANPTDVLTQVALKAAVVIPVPDALKPYVTQWGGDPIWLTDAVYPMPSLHHFSKVVVQQVGVGIEEVTTPVGAWQLAVAGFEVGWDADRALWYCDLHMDAGASYFPFVRLALTRFQPRSVKGAELSRVALADFIQLTPDRLAWVQGVPGEPTKLRVSLSGVAPRSGVPTACANVVVARIEAQQEHDGQLVWVPAAAQPTLLSDKQLTHTVTVWSGEVNLPSPRETQRYRVVLEEYERHVGETSRASYFTGANITGALASDAFRLVYAGTVELEPGG